MVCHRRHETRLEARQLLLCRPDEHVVDEIGAPRRRRDEPNGNPPLRICPGEQILHVASGVGDRGRALDHDRAVGGGAGAGRRRTGCPRNVAQHPQKGVRLFTKDDLDRLSKLILKVQFDKSAESDSKLYKRNKNAYPDQEKDLISSLELFNKSKALYKIYSGDEIGITELENCNFKESSFTNKEIENLLKYILTVYNPYDPQFRRIFRVINSQINVK